MPANSVSAFIVDQFGRPTNYVIGAASGSLHARTQADDRLRPTPPNHFGDYVALLSPWRWQSLVSECRALASHGLVPALLKQRASYVSASAYAPRFIGHDTEYGNEAMAALNDALRMCNLRGSRFGWRETWRMAGPVRATDGDYFVLLTEWGDSGWPAIQILEGHRIGSRNGFAGVVGPDDALTITVDGNGKRSEARGLYRGLAICNGIIYNSAGTEVAYRVLGGSADLDEDISARDLIHVGEPERPSEGRPAPGLAGAALNFLAADLAQTSQLDQQIMDARLTLIETNASGKYEAGSVFQPGGSVSGSASGAPTTIEDRAQTRFIKSGMNLRAHEAARPSDQWMNFDQRVNSRAAAELGWRMEMLDPSALKGAATRAFQDQINTTILGEFAIDEPAIVRVVRYFVAKLAKIGRIPQHAEWSAWGIAHPPWFEVDRASARIDIEEVAAGRLPMSTLHGRDGTTTSQVYAARATAYELALEVAAKHPKVPLEIIIGDLGVTAPRSGFYPKNDPTPDPTAPQPETTTTP